jgi:hypothetical protein
MAGPARMVVVVHAAVVDGGAGRRACRARRLRGPYDPDQLTIGRARRARMAGVRLAAHG